MRHSQNITDLIIKVGEAAPTTEKQYPVLKDLRFPEELTFTIGHSARHFSISTGKLHKIIHDAEHGDKLDIAAVKQQVFSVMFTICKLCELTGMKGDDLIEGVEGLIQKYKEDTEFFESQKDK
jgi:hypothetical protein